MSVLDGGGDRGALLSRDKRAGELTEGFKIDDELSADNLEPFAALSSRWSLPASIVEEALNVSRDPIDDPKELFDEDRRRPLILGTESGSERLRRLERRSR
ncbi:hypothetical protein [Caudoviricetes sp.]|nr:hypothetical protein [Caudoviricetes sp.]